jgi:hypothetical protein
VDAPRWQRLQGHFAGVLGIPIRTVSPSRDLLIAPSWPSSLSPDRVVNLLGVGDELERLLPAGETLRDTATVTTSLGVTYAAVPIFATSDHVVAVFIVGPMVVGRREDEVQFRERISAMELDPQPIWVLLLSLKLYTFSGIRSVLGLMQEVGSSIVEFAYQAKQLSVILPAIRRVDEAVTVYYTDRVLQSLLEAVVWATRADGGSVMLQEPGDGALRIHAAQGLPQTVPTGSRIKRGEGLAGLAMARRAVLLADEQASDPELRQRMARPELVSSLIAPLCLEPGGEPLGVLNLRTENPQRRFTQEHVELVRRLLSLAVVALKGLQAAAHPSPS